jgi:hypothetical protein
VTLHDDAEGHAAGWNPGTDISDIHAPIDLVNEMSLEATFVAPSGNAGPCPIQALDTANDIFIIGCSTTEEGSILTYIITKP